MNPTALLSCNSTASDLSICSQQIAQKNENRFHRRTCDRPIFDDGRVQALSEIILPLIKVKVIDKISGQSCTATKPSVTHESVFPEYYAKKRIEGKPHRFAMTHVAKKLLRVIYTLQTSNVTYNLDLIR